MIIYARERKVRPDILEVKAVQWDWHRNLSARGGQCICWPTSCGLPSFFFLCWLVFTFIQLEKKVSEIPRNFREFIESNNAFHRLCFINNFLRGGHFNRLHKWSGVHSRGLKFGPIAEANHNAKSTLGCDPVGILCPKLWSGRHIGAQVTPIWFWSCRQDLIRTTGGVMELKEVESATCSSRTSITGFNFHFCSDLVMIGLVSLPTVFIQTQGHQ